MVDNDEKKSGFSKLIGWLVGLAAVALVAFFGYSLLHKDSDSVEDKVNSAKDSISEKAKDAKDKAGSIKDNLKEKAESAKDKVKDTFDDVKNRVGVSKVPDGTSSQLNKAVSDGDFEFTVTEVKEFPVIEQENGFKNPTNGKFVRVTVTVKNTSDKEKEFSAADQKLIDNQGNEESNSDESGAAKTNSGSGAKVNIKSNDTITYTLYFDVDKSAKADKLEVHDSALSGGAEIKL